MESRFELGTTCSDTMRNYRLSQKLKLLGYGEFNHLTNILTTNGGEDSVLEQKAWFSPTGLEDLEKPHAH